MFRKLKLVTNTIGYVPKRLFAGFGANIAMNQPLGNGSNFYLVHLAGFFIFLNAVPLGYFASTGRFISFIGTCQIRGAILLAWRYMQLRT
jgi:hypothetical protein